MAVLKKAIKSTLFWLFSNCSKYFEKCSLTRHGGVVGYHASLTHSRSPLRTRLVSMLLFFSEFAFSFYRLILFFTFFLHKCHSFFSSLSVFHFVNSFCSVVLHFPTIDSFFLLDQGHPSLHRSFSHHPFLITDFPPKFSFISIRRFCPKMLYKVVAAATFMVSSVCVLTQLVLLPWLNQYTQQLKTDFESRLRRFHHNARLFDDQYRRISQFTVGSDLSLESSAFQRLTKRQLDECPPQRVGPTGPPGEGGADGEPGDTGEDGLPGLDAITLLLEEAQKCIICPQGPEGPIGAPGLQGFPGTKGDKGDPGMPGTDGTDGDQGPEGLPGHPGIAGKQGKRGTAGSPAPGGTGPPGLSGVKGPPGQTGKQGERGKRNFVIGMPGPDGRIGKQGLDGLEGKPGQRGEKGPPGEDGADAKFCPCPSELSSMGGESKPISSRLLPNSKADQQMKAFAPLPPPPQQIPPPSVGTAYNLMLAEKAKDKMRESVPTTQKEAKTTIYTLKETMTNSTIPTIVTTKVTTTTTTTTMATKTTQKIQSTKPTESVGTTQQNSNLKIGHLKPGERPNGQENMRGKGQNYEDVYPNYESPNDQKRKNEGKEETEYDNEVQMNGEDETRGEENGGKGPSDGSDDEAEEGQVEQSTTVTRRFVYVTKRPRPKL